MSGDNIKLSAEFGTSPVGSEVVEWDYIAHESGWRERYEYVIIPDESVDVDLPWTSYAPETFLSVCDALNTDHAAVRFTISDTDRQSFHASCWVRVSEAVESVTNFVKENS